MYPSRETIITIKSGLIGIAAGAAGLAVVGFGWGGWVTGATAEKIAAHKAGVAVVLALSPICVDNFRRQPNAGAKLAGFQQLPSYEQTNFIQKGGWAASLEDKDGNSAITHACAESLAKLTAADLG
jgi:hypothetical protein